MKKFSLAVLVLGIMSLLWLGCASQPNIPEPLPPVLKHNFAAKQSPPIDYAQTQIDLIETEAQYRMALESQPKISLDFPNRSLQDAFADIQLELKDQGQNINLVVSDNVQGLVNTRFEEEPLEVVIKTLCDSSGYFWAKKTAPDGRIYYYIGSASPGDPTSLNLWVTEKIYTDRPAWVVQQLMNNPMYTQYISVAAPRGDSEERGTSRRNLTTSNNQYQPIIGERKVESHELVISGPKPIVDHIKQVIKGVVDTPRRMVAISALFTESRFNKGHQIGVDWSQGVDLSVDGQLNKGKNFAFGWQTNAMGQLLSSIQAMVAKGDLQLKDFPRICTTENTEATIHLQTEERYRTERRRNLTSNSYVYREQIETVISDIILKVTPIIKDNGDVHVIIDAEVDEFSGYNADNLPIVNKRYVSNEISVKSGETIVIGGLYQDLVMSGKTGIAGLGQLPILDIPLSMRNKNQETKELTVFITAEVLQPEYAQPSPAAEVSETSEDISWWLRPIDEAKKQLNGTSEASTLEEKVEPEK